MAKIIFIVACLIACFAPFAVMKESKTVSTTQIAFPTEFEGRTLRDLGLSDRERAFLVDFPGQIGRFTDGEREIIIRHVTEATRMLHPADDCFKAVGYTTAPLPVKVDAANSRWACFSAIKNKDNLRVCERIEDKKGREWTDVSSWYWAVWGSDRGDWWAYTVAEHLPDAN